jgi:hypothetical protein
MYVERQIEQGRRWLRARFKRTFSGAPKSRTTTTMTVMAKIDSGT